MGRRTYDKAHSWVQKKDEKRPERKDNNSEYFDVIRSTMIAA